jgi:single-stranded-DNA-specific exonuclease
MKRILPEAEFSAENQNQIKRLAKECNLLPETVSILFGRGIDTQEKIQAFIHPSKARFLSPYKMSGMQETVELIARARQEDWAVVVYGDYDADGVCAATILSNALIDYGIEPMVYVPERKNGYGLNKANIDEIFDEFCPQLFITVDCGISNAEEVEYIKEMGAEVIVTDHHELPEKLPDCILVNPKFNDNYPYDNLCGAGVAFKVACALNGEDAYKYLDFAAIATVADSVPLLGENRDIVYEGLKLINAKPRSAYTAFLGKSGDGVTAQTLAFSIAPKINAAGRMGDANAALRLFNEQDEAKVYDLSVKLTAYNTERQQCCDELYQSAKEKLNQTGAYSRVIMLWDEEWNTGFVGIVAARLAEEYGRPCLLFVKNGDMLKGSARSIESVNIFEALKACSEYIEEFGGHSQAAGVNITIENFAKLQAALDGYMHEKYTYDAFIPTLYTQRAVTGVNMARFSREIEMLEPFGVGNKRPLFVLDKGACLTHPVKPQSPHLVVKCDELEFMYFSGSKYSKLLQSEANKKIIFEYNISRFRGKEYVKGFIRDIIFEGKNLNKIAEECAVNLVLTLAAPPVPCQKKLASAAVIDQAIAQENEVYGTVYLAYNAATLDKFPHIKKFACELFHLSSRNLANTVLLAPQTDVDLSGYKNIVFLDDPKNIAIVSLAGKTVTVCADISATQSLKNLSSERQTLLGFYSRLVAQMQDIEGTSVEEVALQNTFGVPKAQAAFALKVFEELGLISFESGKLIIYRGIKTNLTQSPLYRLVSGE